MNYIKITTDDIANGEGIGVVLWVSGCRLHCKGCHNPQTWDFNAGVPFTEESMQELLNALDKPYITRLTISGGHPLEEENLSAIYSICKIVNEEFPDKTIWVYTGYKWENLLAKSLVNGAFRVLLNHIDVLVDGAYIDEQRDLTLAYRGSSNQRVINVPFSRMDINPVLYCK